MRGRKGFVGPLGDDIPSIFPMVAGIMLFVGTLAFAGDLVAQKNSLLEVRKAAVSLSYIVTDKGMVTRESWDAKCVALKKAGKANNVRVLATVKRFCGEVVFPDPNQQPPPEPQLSPYYAGESNALRSTWRYCSDDWTAGQLPFEKLRYPVIFNYPVAVPCPDESSPGYGPGILNLIVWR